MKYFRDPVTQRLLHWPGGAETGGAATKMSDIDIHDTDNSFSGTTNAASLFDTIPGALQSAIVARKPSDDVARYLQQALDELAASGGGTLYVPAGSYRLNREIRLPKGVTIVGAGRTATVLAIGHAGHALRSVAPINATTFVNLALRSFGIACAVPPGTSNGAGVYDTGGTYVEITDIAVTGMAYGILLDQSEIVDIDLCQLEYQTHSAVRIVNGPLFSPGARTGYTNRISVTRTQFNQAVRWAILDDGGFSHYFAHNNYNGCTQGHIRVAGYTQVTISGGEWEGTPGPNILLSNTSYGGRDNDVGRPELVLVQGTTVAAAGTRNAVKVEACNALTLIGNFFDGGTAPSVGGVANVERLHAVGNRVRNPAGMFGGGRAYGSHVAVET